MNENLWRWAAWLQALALIGGGMLISAASTRTWNGWQAASSTGEGQITLALGGVAVLLGALRFVYPGRSSRFLATVVGLWLSTAVMMITIQQLNELKGYNQDVLAFVSPQPRPGLYLTLAGGCITGIGSLLGVAPADPVALPWTNLRASTKKA